MCDLLKYFTREWFELRNGSNIYEFMTITKEAEAFSEEHFQNLYKAKLEDFLNNYKEMSKLTVDDIFPVNSWSNISTIDKDWNFVDVSTIVTAEVYQKIKEEIARKEQEARARFVPIVYEEEKLIQQFHDNNFKGRLKYLESLLPEDIMKDIADIRLLALDEVSKEIWDRIYLFCSIKEAQTSKVEKEFQEYYNLSSPKLPEKIQHNYNFHDCRVTSYEQQGKEVTIGLDHSGGFTNVCKVIYHNAVVLEQEDIVRACWLDSEIYAMEEGYEFHAVLQGEDILYKYLTLWAADVDFITD
jgi:hypothetical protein